MNKSRGFSLIELLFALSIITILVSLTVPFMGQLISFKENSETSNNIKGLNMALKKWYEDSAFGIDSNTASGLLMPDGTYATNNTAVLGTKWSGLLSRVGLDDRYLVDGFGRNYKFFVSNRLQYAYEGVLIPYRIIAIVSAGTTDRDADGSSDVKSTFDPATGVLTSAAGEIISTFSGLDVQVRKFEDSKAKLRELADAYGQYYWARYRASANEPSVNYFARNGTDIKWDASADPARVVEVTCGKPAGTLSGVTLLGTNIKNSKLNTALGLTDASILDSYGREFRILNCGTTSGMRVSGASYSLTVRDPSIGNGLPPYTAAMGFTMPNSESYIISVTSRF
ncbi:type II secretion system protein [Aeromonas sp. 23P]|uniref:type II secretion system protein n=1 Tax=Aeromonas sp. 23P TaxID=3452716 RepID=UPI003F7B0D38|nr:type II secretion system protein [Aeromonas veronii]